MPKNSRLSTSTVLKYCVRSLQSFPPPPVVQQSTPQPQLMLSHSMILHPPFTPSFVIFQSGIAFDKDHRDAQADPSPPALIAGLTHPKLPPPPPRSLIR